MSDHQFQGPTPMLAEEFGLDPNECGECGRPRDEHDS